MSPSSSLLPRPPPSLGPLFRLTEPTVSLDPPPLAAAATGPGVEEREREEADANERTMEAAAGGGRSRALRKGAPPFGLLLHLPQHASWKRRRRGEGSAHTHSHTGENGGSVVRVEREEEEEEGALSLLPHPVLLRTCASLSRRRERKRGSPPPTFSLHKSTNPVTERREGASVKTIRAAGGGGKKRGKGGEGRP